MLFSKWMVGCLHHFWYRWLSWEKIQHHGFVRSWLMRCILHNLVTRKLWSYSWKMLHAILNKALRWLLSMKNLLFSTIFSLISRGSGASMVHFVFWILKLAEDQKKHTSVVKIYCINISAHITLRILYHFLKIKNLLRNRNSSRYCFEKSISKK